MRDGVATSEIEDQHAGRVCASADYQHWAVASGTHQCVAIVHDGKIRRFKTAAEGSLESIEPMAMSPDGKRLAYQLLHVSNLLMEAGRAGESASVLFVDDKRQRFPGTAYALRFSSDSRRLACFMRDFTSRKCMVVLDGRIGPTFDHAYISMRSVHFDAAGKLHYIAAKDGVLYRVTQD